MKDNKLGMSLPISTRLVDTMTDEQLIDMMLEELMKEFKKKTSVTIYRFRTPLNDEIAMSEVSILIDLSG
jgi:hypothetical protein